MISTFAWNLFDKITVERISGKSQAQVGWSVWRVSTRSNFLEKKGKVGIEFRTKLQMIQFKLDMNSVQQAFELFPHLWHCCRPVQMDPQHSLNKFIKQKVGKNPNRLQRSR